MSSSGPGDVTSFFRLVLGIGTGKPVAEAGGGTQPKSGSGFLEVLYVRGGSGGLETGGLLLAGDGEKGT